MARPALIFLVVWLDYIRQRIHYRYQSIPSNRSIMKITRILSAWEFWRKWQLLEPRKCPYCKRLKWPVPQQILTWASLSLWARCGCPVPWALLHKCHVFNVLEEWVYATEAGGGGGWVWGDTRKHLSCHMILWGNCENNFFSTHTLDFYTLFWIFCPLDHFVLDIIRVQKSLTL